MLLKIKLGRLELEYEGSEEFLKTELPAVLESLSQVTVSEHESEDEHATPESVSANGAGAAPGTKSSIQMSTSNVAAKLGCASATDLALAASAHLTLVMGKDTFNRDELLDDMQSATSYYMESHRKNLSRTLTTLIKDGKLIERSNNVFALHASQRQQLEENLSR